MSMAHIPKEIGEYPRMVLDGEIHTCVWQQKLMELVSDCFEKEDLFFNVKQFETYMTYEKYFPYRLFPWERFVFGLHCCTYRADGTPRWPTLLLYLGRGTGKNGYLSFEDFCLLTAANGIMQYHIDTFATSEDQAKTTFEELHDILESTPKLKHFFYWNKEEIINLQTKSRYRYRTGNAKTKDSGRQGKIDYDEVHQYQNYDLINVGNSGMGKKPHPRRTITSSDGWVREGPLDDYKQQGKDILNRLYDDNGMLPFLCCIESQEEIDMPEMWEKANPSLRYMPNLMAEMQRQYADYKRQSSGNLEFPTKRLNFPIESKEQRVTDYKNLLASKQATTYYAGQEAVAAMDFASRRDFAVVGHLTRQGDLLQWREHGFILKSNPDLERIRAPLLEWAQKGLLTFVEGVEISPELLINWLIAEQEEQGLTYVAAAVDYFRYGIVKKSLDTMGFESGRDGNLKLVRPSDLMMIAPEIMSVLDNQRLACGDDPFFRWCANNVGITQDKKGNLVFEKIEAKSRKTDGFMAFAAAMTQADKLPDYKDYGDAIGIYYA